MIGAIASISTLLSTVISRIWPDATEAEKAKLAILSQELEQEFRLVAGQLEINREEAKHEKVFVAGWRPYIGWVCGSTLAYAALIEPIMRFIAMVIFGYAGAFPAIDTEITMQVLLGILGLGGLRTAEKIKRVNGDHR